MVAQPQEQDNVIPMVKSATNAEIYSAVMGVQIMLTRQQEQIKTISMTVERLSDGLAQLNREFSEEKGQNRVTREQVGSLQTQLADHEVRMRGQADQMRELDVITTSLKDLHNEIGKLAAVIAANEQLRKDENKGIEKRLRALEDWKWYLAGGIAMGSVLGGIIAELFIGRLF